MIKIKNIEFTKILNSGGKYAIQTKLEMDKHIIGIASSPSAIMAGEREVKSTDFIDFNNENLKLLIEELKKIKIVTQKKVDEILNNYIDILGSDVCLSISLAFARANAKYHKKSLINYIENECKIKSNYKSPYPLIAIFSGGVHGNQGSLQQIMLSVNTNDFNQAINIILKVYNEIEKELKEKDFFLELGASSGFVTKNMTVEEQFELLQETIKKLKLKNVSIGIDVAAEHFYKDKKYFFQRKYYDSKEFIALLQSYKNKYNLTFIEDPLDTNSKDDWILFKNNNKDIDIAGDDLFATQAIYLNSNEANTTIIKINQSGTLTKTLETITEAKKQGIKLCVSHRSYETEDTFMCDLAVATNSEYIKIGGPRRGDRISKYNRIINIIK